MVGRRSFGDFFDFLPKLVDLGVQTSKPLDLVGDCISYIITCIRKKVVFGLGYLGRRSFAASQLRSRFLGF